MKIVEIVPQVRENAGAYSTENKSRRRDITQKFSQEEIKKAIRTAEYQPVSVDVNINVSINREEWEYINAYAKGQNISIQLAVQWFWNQGFRLMRGTHKARSITEPGLGVV
jgi:hypothetical protein